MLGNQMLDKQVLAAGYAGGQQIGGLNAATPQYQPIDQAMMELDKSIQVCHQEFTDLCIRMAPLFRPEPQQHDSTSTALPISCPHESRIRDLNYCVEQLARKIRTARELICI